MFPFDTDDTTFDELMISQATILRKTNKTSNKMGVANQEMSPIATNVPCRVSTKSKGRPREEKAGKKYAFNYRTVYMRPYTGTGFPLTQHDWVQVVDLQGVTHNYDIIEVVDPSNAGHHFELICEEILP